MIFAARLHGRTGPVSYTHLDVYKRQALLLSCPPEIFLGACASLPYEASELNMAAQIRGEPIAMRACKTIDLQVPASCDIVVEGRFLPNVKRPEGPFGEFMGNYVEVGDNHVFEVSHVEYRKGAVLSLIHI